MRKKDSYKKKSTKRNTTYARKKNKRSKRKKELDIIWIIAAAAIVLIILFVVVTNNITNEKNAYMESEMGREYLDDEVILNVYDDGKILKMKLSDYLVGVVSCEMPASYNIEALKAQAMAARTYTIYKIEHISCDKSSAADICTDSSHCQAFDDEEYLKDIWKDEYESYREKITGAVRQTDGKIITYDGEVIQALYTASCGGVTEDAENVFGNALPYLVSVESADEDEKEKVYRFSLDEYADRLKSYYKNMNISAEDAKTKTKMPKRYDTGRVEYIKIAGTEVSGGTMRRIFALPSTMFNIEFNKNEVVFTCKGYGHGVGLSQVGANGYANNGLTAEKIIKHYYTGTEIESIK